MDHTSGITPTYAPTQEQQEAIPPAQPVDGAPSSAGAAPAVAGADRAPADASEPEPAGFQSRGRARRRARFLRKARELAYRDLGGLVFNLHRFGQRNDALVLAKLSTLGHIDDELRGIEGTLGERRPITVLREAGITACPRCAAIHSSEDNFCPNCGLSMARHADLPAGFQAVAGAGAPSPQPLASTAAPPAAAPAPPATPAPAPPATPAPAPISTGQGSPASAPAPPTSTPTPAPPEPTRAEPAPPPPTSPASQPAGSPPAQSSQAHAPGAAEDGPTEILRGPTSGS